MKLLKASKGLIKAIACLVASVVLCAGACLAWFATNGKVDANDLNSNVKSTNIKDFTVTAYYLTLNKGTTDKYTVGATVSFSSDENVISMPKYEGETNRDRTALLLEFECVFYDDLGKQYAINAECKETFKAVDGGIVNKNGYMEFRLNCALSSVVGFYGITETSASAGGTITKISTAKTVNRKSATSYESVVELNENTGSNAATQPTIYISDTGANGSDSVKFYCIIDYVESKIDAQYSAAANNSEIEGLTPSSPMDFTYDIDYYIQEA